MTTTRDYLIQAGEALYGASFAGPLAADLGCSRRNVERWAAGTRQPRDPERLADDLRALLRARAQAIRALL